MLARCQIRLASRTMSCSSTCPHVTALFQRPDHSHILLTSTDHCLPLLLSSVVPGLASELSLVLHSRQLIFRLDSVSSHANPSHSIVDLRLLGRSRLNRPVEDIVVLEAFSNKQVSEELSQVRVVGLVVESKRSTIVEVDGEFVGETSAENLGGSSHLLLHDPVVLLLLSSSLESLPWELTSEEVLAGQPDHNIRNSPSRRNPAIQDHLVEIAQHPSAC